jgi:hypothetical protein
MPRVPPRPPPPARSPATRSPSPQLPGGRWRARPEHERRDCRHTSPPGAARARPSGGGPRRRPPGRRRPARARRSAWSPSAASITVPAARPGHGGSRGGRAACPRRRRPSGWSRHAWRLTFSAWTIQSPDPGYGSARPAGSHPRRGSLRVGRESRRAPGESGAPAGCRARAADRRGGGSACLGGGLGARGQAGSIPGRVGGPTRTHVCVGGRGNAVRHAPRPRWGRATTR